MQDSQRIWAGLSAEFRISKQVGQIDDANENGSWDTGSVVLRIQPETVRYFTNPIRIRGNWDVEVELVATP
jgi:hypothetical protein